MNRKFVVSDAFLQAIMEAFEAYDDHLEEKGSYPNRRDWLFVCKVHDWIVATKCGEKPTDYEYLAELDEILTSEYEDDNTT